MSGKMNGSHHVDIVIVGASVAGCSAAVLFGRLGFRVAVVEQSADPEKYKKTCTHFIQACARGTLSRLGLDAALASAGAVDNPLQLWTRWGWIEAAASSITGVNIRRQTLDPILRGAAERTPGVVVLPGHAVRGLLYRGRQVAGILARGPAGENVTVHARLTVAADGRSSSVAALAKVPAVERVNNRFTYFTYYERLPLTRQATAQYWYLGENLAYAFVNDQGMTLLGCFLPRNQLGTFRKDVEESFVRFWENVPEGPPIRSARRACEFRGALKLTNAWRPGAAGGVAFLGDAALCLDPIWGTGCGWAIESAAWLVDSCADALAARSPTQLDAALKRYSKLHKQKTRGHALHIADFSVVRENRWIEELLFSAAARDEEVGELVHTYLGRRIGPAALLRPNVLARCLWVNGRALVRTSKPTLQTAAAALLAPWSPTEQT